MLQTFTICDDLKDQDTCSIEVVLDMQDGSQRWCFFMTPNALISCGDWVGGTQTRIHYGAPHMIVISERLTKDSIARALKHIAHIGDIEKCSLPIL